MDVTPYLELKPAPRFLFDALEARAERPRFMVKGAEGWTPVTYRAFADEVRAFARYLRLDGLTDEGRVAVYAPNRVEWAAAAQAIQAAGGVLVPIYPSCTAAQAGYVIDHCDAEVVVVDTQPLLERVLEGLGGADDDRVRRIVCLDDDLSVSAAVEAIAARGKRAPDAAALDRRAISWSAAVAAGRAADREAPEIFDRALAGLTLERRALMLYTSGTTGHPKGVPLTHRNFATNHRDWMQVLAPRLQEGATDLLWLPMSHMFGYGETFVGTALGWTSYLCAPHEAVKLMPEVRPEAFLSVPAYWEKLAQGALSEEGAAAQQAALQASTGGRLSFCLSGGAGLKQEVKALFERCGILILEGYGLTETSPTLTMNAPDAYRFDTVGKPFPSVALKLAEDGEILARGPNVFAGYHKDPVATQGAFTADGWFKTGDVGAFTEDGFLKIVDRKKDILVTAGGKNVPPANIELRFRDDALIEHLVVYGDGKKFLTAGVWVQPAEAERLGLSGAALEAEVERRIARVNEDLAKHETVKAFRILDAPLTVDGGLLTPTLKVRRKQVYERFGPALEALYG